jgi:3-oxoacyl-[acyl-carrier protein] reductase
MDLNLNGRRAIVGGASKGLGYAVARALLSEGASVVICARDGDRLAAAADDLEAEMGSRPVSVTADLTRAEDRAGLFDRAVREMGGVDILVANAGGPPPGPFESHGPDNWRLAIDLALGSVTHLCALALPGMKERRFGRIVQIVSIAGLEVVDGLILSNASRPAVLGFAKALAREVAAYGILVNSICPGVFMTDRIRELAVERAAAAGVTTERFLEGFCADIPIGRPGEPAELGDLAAYLCSPRNTYVTGAAIPIDGAKTRRLF